MKTTLIQFGITFFGIVIGGLSQCASANTERMLNWAEAEAKQKSDPKTQLFLLSGTDWDALSAKAIAAWNHPLTEKAAEGMRLLHVDYPDYGKEGEEGTNRDPGNKKFLLRPRAFHFPVVAMHDADGVPVGRIDGFDASKTDLAEAITSWKSLLTKRDLLLAKAKDSNGASKARFIGQALDLFPLKIARGHHDWIKKLVANDPDDRTGYVAKYTMDPERISYEARAVGKHRKWEEINQILTRIEELLKVSVITKEQRQELMASRAACHLYMRKHKPILADYLKTLNEIARINPESEAGIGARGLLMREEDIKKFDSIKEKLENDPDNRSLLLELIKLHHESGSFLRGIPLRGKFYSRLPSIGFEGTVSQSSFYKGHDNWQKNLIGNTHFGGSAFTESETNPWIMISFKESKTILHVTVVHASSKGDEKDTPLLVEASKDGKTWREIHRMTEFKHAVHVRLDRPVRAKHIRCRRAGNSTKSLRLSNFWIYGM